MKAISKGKMEGWQEGRKEGSQIQILGVKQNKQANSNK